MIVLVAQIGSLSSSAPRKVQLDISMRAAGDVDYCPAEGLVQRTHRGTPAPDTLPRT